MLPAKTAFAIMLPPRFPAPHGRLTHAQHFTQFQAFTYSRAGVFSAAYCRWWLGLELLAAATDTLRIVTPCYTFVTP
jgi:hypothetical protein